jgi:capsular exopolysaccharide synthesis family protein
LSNEPVSPNKTLILLSAALLGFTIPIGIILIQQFMDTSIGSSTEVEALLNIPVIAKLPQVKKMTDNKSVIFNGSERLKKSAQFLITDLKQDFGLQENIIFVITSFEQVDGKTFTTVSLAANFARLGQRVLILDTDINRGDLKTYFPPTDQHAGLMEFLSSDKDLKHFISNSPFNKMHYVAAGKGVNNSDKSLLPFENKLEAMFTHLKKYYDVVIVDTPAFTETADYFLLSKFFSINLVVIRHKKTSKTNLQENISSLTRKNIKNLKLLYNDVPIVAQ